MELRILRWGSLAKKIRAGLQALDHDRSWNIELRIFSIEGLLQESAGLHALDQCTGSRKVGASAFLSWRTARCEQLEGATPGEAESWSCIVFDRGTRLQIN
jgi:hypothetical protein